MTYKSTVLTNQHASGKVPWTKLKHISPTASSKKVTCLSGLKGMRNHEMTASRKLLVKHLTSEMYKSWLSSRILKRKRSKE